MNFDWFNISWLMQNLHWFIILLGVSIILLFFFPVILGIDLKNKADNLNSKNSND
tara:strand:+ start:3132 stop:3296 length:165 start_codon:yes stop_codon:yes gene_type:complete